MFSLWLEHYNIKTARRALLMSSFVAILLPSLEIYGDGIQILGLTFSLERSSILTTTRLVAFYFLWIFFWLNLSSVAEDIRTIINRYIEEKIEIEASAAEEAEREAWEPNNAPEPEREPWWGRYDQEKVKLIKKQTFMIQPLKLLGLAAIVFVEYAPPFTLAFFGIFKPEYANDFVFSLFS